MTSLEPTTTAVDRLGGGQMFDRIARRYDLMNRLISLGLDSLWRRRLVQAISPIEGGQAILDAATGTADVALALSAAYPEATVTGLDPSTGMLAIGHEKVRDNGAITLVEGDAQALPFEEGHFAGVTIAFGIRNVPDRLLGLREMTRVLRPGGTLAILELGEPRRGLLAPFARFHVHHVVPFLGGLLSGSREYRYLQESIAAFPSPEDFVALMAEAGLESCRFADLSFGACQLYTGTKPRT